MGHELHCRARGIDHRPIVTHRAAKSISKETTFARDIRDGASLRRELNELARGVGQQLRAEGLRGVTVKLKLRWPDFTTVTRQAGRVHLRIAEDARVDGERLAALVRGTPGATLSPGGVLSFPAPPGDEILAALVGWLAELERREAA